MNKVYQELKHCLVLITHLELTKDPPQKWFPFLHRETRWRTAQQRLRRVCGNTWSPPHTPVPEAHGPRRVSRKAVHDTPHSPQHAVLSFPTLTELNLLCVHNRTRMRNVIGTKIPEEPCCLKSETNQLIQSGTLFLQLFKNIKKHTSC